MRYHISKNKLLYFFLTSVRCGCVDLFEIRWFVPRLEPHLNLSCGLCMKCAYPCWWWSLLPANSPHVFPFLGHENILRNSESTRVSSKLARLCWKGRTRLRQSGDPTTQSETRKQARAPSDWSGGVHPWRPGSSRSLSLSVAGTLCVDGFYGSSFSVPVEESETIPEKGLPGLCERYLRRSFRKLVG